MNIPTCFPVETPLRQDDGFTKGVILTSVNATRVIGYVDRQHAAWYFESAHDGVSFTVNGTRYFFEDIGKRKR